jgi:aspartate dehydrogenase
MIPCAIMEVGVVGLGAIGRPLCRALDDGITGLHLAGATARDREKAERFLKSLGSPAPLLSLDELIRASDLVIEASTQAHLRDEIAPKTLAAGKDLVVLSCGGLIGRQALPHLRSLGGDRGARRRQGREGRRDRLGHDGDA